MDQQNDTHVEDRLKLQARKYSALDLILDLETMTALVHGAPVLLRNKPMQLLLLLMDRQGCVVSKSEIIEAVWEGRAVTDYVISTAVRDIRRALGEKASDQVYIKTVARVGYSFVPEVSIEETSPRTHEVIPKPSLNDLPNSPNRHSAFMLLMSVALLAVAFLSLNGIWETRVTNGLAYFSIQASPDNHGSAQFSDGLADLVLASSWFVSKPEEATFQISLENRIAGEEAIRSTILKIQSMSEELGRITIPLTPEKPVSSAKRILEITEHILRCHKEISDAVSEDTGTSNAFRKIVFSLCDQSRGQDALQTNHQLTEQLWQIFPTEPNLKALHLVMLATRPEHHMLARVDLYRDAHLSQISALAEDLKQVHERTQLIDYSLDLAAAISKDRADMVPVLSNFPPTHWIGLRTSMQLATFYRFAGRLKDANRLLVSLKQNWPAADYIEIIHLLTRLMMGGLDTARDTIETGAMAKILPELRTITSIAYTFYGSEEETLTVDLEAPPDVLLPCFQDFTAVRKSELPKDQFDISKCTPVGPVLVARMLAILGNGDQAIGIIRQFEAHSTGPALTLHYPEYKPLWRDGTLIGEAQRLGMIEFWQQTGVPPDYCYEPGFQELCSNIR